MNFKKFKNKQKVIIPTSRIGLEDMYYVDEDGHKRNGKTKEIEVFNFEAPKPKLSFDDSETDKETDKEIEDDADSFNEEDLSKERIDPLNDVSEVSNESLSLGDKDLISVSDFIKENNYQMVIGSWFKDLWFPLFEKKDVLITNEVLSFIYKDAESYRKQKKGQDVNISCEARNILSNSDFHFLKENYRKFLIKNDIPFETIKYYKTILNDYPSLEDEISSKKYLAQKTWLKLKTDNFKESIMFMNNSNSKNIRRYYILLEKLLFDYSKYISDYQNRKLEMEFETKLMIKEKENEELKNKVSLVNDMVIERGNIKKNQVFYIATSKFYAMENIFKIGGVENESLIKSRFQTYNTERPKNDIFYYAAVFKCHDYRLVEHFVSSFLFNFKLPNKKELFRINFDDLLDAVTKLINQLDEYISYFNCIQPILIDNLIHVRELKEDIKMRNNESSVWINSNNYKKKRFNVLTNEIK